MKYTVRFPFPNDSHYSSLQQKSTYFMTPSLFTKEAASDCIYSSLPCVKDVLFDLKLSPLHNPLCSPRINLSIVDNCLNCQGLNCQEAIGESAKIILPLHDHSKSSSWAATQTRFSLCYCLIKTLDSRIFS